MNTSIAETIERSIEAAADPEDAFQLSRFFRPARDNTAKGTCFSESAYRRQGKS